MAQQENTSAIPQSAAADNNTNATAAAATRGSETTIDDTSIPEFGSRRHTEDDISTAHSTILNEKIDNNNKSNWFSYLWGDIYAKDDPNQYSQKKKNVIIFLVALGGLCGPLSSMMYMPGLLAVAADLNTTTSAVNGTISAFVVFMGISVSLQNCCETTHPNFFYFSFFSRSFGPPLVIATVEKECI